MARFKITPIALALVALSVQAQGQQPADRTLPEVRVQGNRQSDGYNPPTSASGTKIEAPLRDVPQTINVVPHEVLTDTGARSLQDALRTVPGVGLSHGDGSKQLGHFC